MKYVVYKHTTPNNKVYIGITSQNKINRRWQNGYGYRSNKHFFNAILKYGWDNIKHEILYNNLTEDEACKKEVELIKLYKSKNRKYGYNLSFGGECSANGVVFSDERRKKISEAHKGKHLSEEAKQKIRIANKGKKLSDIHKQILSETRKGKNNPMYGKHTNNKQKEAVAKACGKPVICIETNKVYPTILEAQRQTGICDSGIQAVCKKYRQTAGGYHWEYVEVS